jgi:hypothetical protein
MYYNGTWPSCSIDPSDCSALLSTWSSAESATSSWTQAFITTVILDTSATAVTYGNSITGSTTEEYTVSDGSLPVITVAGTAYTPDSGVYTLPWTLNGSYPDYTMVSDFRGTQTIVPPSTVTISASSTYWEGSWVSPSCASTTASPSTITAANGSTSVSSAQCTGGCTIAGGTVKLFYFPETKNATRDMCTLEPTATGTVCPFGTTVGTAEANCGASCTPCSYYPFNFTSTQDTGPYTVFDGNTFYANRAYISLETAYATDSCGNTIGNTYAGTMLTLPSSYIYSIYSTDDHGLLVNSATQFNFADLNANVPAVAYKGAMWCVMEGPPSPAIQSLFGGYIDLNNYDGSSSNNSFGDLVGWDINYDAWVRNKTSPTTWTIANVCHLKGQ